MDIHIMASSFNSIQQVLTKCIVSVRNPGQRGFLSFAKRLQKQKLTTQPHNNPECQYFKTTLYCLPLKVIIYPSYSMFTVGNTVVPVAIFRLSAT